MPVYIRLEIFMFFVAFLVAFSANEVDAVTLKGVDENGRKHKVEGVHMTTKILAHRGFSAAAPENTLAAFKAAIEAGADGFELDVHMTKDGELVVIHDEMVDRTTNGKGWVKDLTLSDIKVLDAGSWFSPQFAQEKVPTLGEVLELVGDTDHIVNVELKNYPIAYPGLEEKVIKEVEKMGMENRVILSSFNHLSVYRLHQLHPSLKLGILYDKPISEPWAYAKGLGASAIHPHHSLVTEEIVTGAHDYGIQVRPYTVDHEDEARNLVAVGVDAIVTNVPDRLRNWVQEFC